MLGLGRLFPFSHSLLKAKERTATGSENWIMPTLIAIRRSHLLCTYCN